MEPIPPNSINYERLKNAEALYADAHCLVEYAWARGVPKSVPIFTSSPGLLQLGLSGVEALDASLTSSKFVELEDAALAIASDVYDTLSPDHHHGVAAARAAFSPLHILLLKAAALREEDLDRTVVVTRVTTSHDKANNRYYGVIADLLRTNSDLEVIDVDETEVAQFAESAPPVPPFLTRLGYLNRSAFDYQFKLAASRFFKRSKSGTIYILRENELVKETATVLAKSGYRLERLSMPRVARPSIEAPDSLVRTSYEIAQRHLQSILPGRIASATADCFSKEVRKASSRYLSMLEPWRKLLTDKRDQNPVAILSNFLSDAGSVALHRAASEQGIAVAVFQHGVTMEIHERARLSHIIHENAVADIALAFNPAAKSALDCSRFGIGKSFAVGLPKDYGRGRTFGNSRKFPPIWYVSTSLYLGNQGLLYTGVNDHDKAVFEQQVVEDILAKIPHDVLYKPYPGIRYLDSDPVVEAAERATNISVFEERIDLRYIVGAARVLITSRSYSTPSWCLMTGKPLVHIDIPGQAALTSEARAAFDAGLFLFDAADTDFHEKIRKFLSRPIAEIESEYAAKKSSRQQLIDEYISGPPGHAGTAAASVILDHISETRAG